MALRHILIEVWSCGCAVARFRGLTSSGTSLHLFVSAPSRLVRGLPSLAARVDCVRLHVVVLVRGASLVASLFPFIPRLCREIGASFFLVAGLMLTLIPSLSSSSALTIFICSASLSGVLRCCFLLPQNHPSHSPSIATASVSSTALKWGHGQTTRWLGWSTW